MLSQIFGLKIQTLKIYLVRFEFDSIFCHWQSAFLEIVIGLFTTHSLCMCV